MLEQYLKNCLCVFHHNLHAIEKKKQIIHIDKQCKEHTASSTSRHLKEMCSEILGKSLLLETISPLTLIFNF
jgi:hypothetical protein